MAQTRKRRRRKHRGTQSGSIDRKRQARPRNRQEARARARSDRGARYERPPTWRGAVNRGLIAAGLFAVLLLVFFRQPAGTSIALAAFMLLFYIPMGYYIDSFMWRRRQRSKTMDR